MSDADEKVTVYHGTCASAAAYIRGDGLVPQGGHKSLFVTTNRDAARKYAWAWTGYVKQIDLFLDQVEEHNHVEVLDIDGDRRSIRAQTRSKCMSSDVFG